MINQLFQLLNQANDNTTKVSNYYLQHSQFAGGLTDAERVYINQTSKNVDNTDNLD
ncbi:hypothetical protein NIES4071_04520 [Calothrix sp. NIES-4071]|nr:hypothetical protein NIES4071_04520 [Calothrix sp. NIES-4071]BAZ54798.1 hypothetical protein NIES4105_04510 [Calothrix sp. NIES-4105]